MKFAPKNKALLDDLPPEMQEELNGLPPEKVELLKSELHRMNMASAKDNFIEMQKKTNENLMHLIGHLTPELMAQADAFSRQKLTEILEAAGAAPTVAKIVAALESIGALLALTTIYGITNAEKIAEEDEDGDCTHKGGDE